MSFDGLAGTKTTRKLLALDAVKANLMVADANLNIMYMNPSVIELLKEAEIDLKKELPRFSVSTLIGQFKLSDTETAAGHTSRPYDKARAA